MKWKTFFGTWIMRLLRARGSHTFSNVGCFSANTFARRTFLHNFNIVRSATMLLFVEHGCSLLVAVSYVRRSQKIGSRLPASGRLVACGRRNVVVAVVSALPLLLTPRLRLR